jgi:hypothetical protein
MGHITSGFIINKSEIYTCTTNDNEHNMFFHQIYVYHTDIDYGKKF